MFNLFHNHKGSFFVLTLSLLICSMTTTFTVNNHISDGVSILFSIMLSMLLISLVLALLWEKIEGICNP
ncbi:hypothetical protein P255_00396 [Acinetobacter brisouii CIP 110357]|uniref:Uncharacterized protein n=1 Tax=Acinetobacter brisouii CIP 110357 TaxID=1341683 RepID=V2UUA5_9GAMM|nr:hypothetical protein F954_02236 [Acinetobacter brisouii ANC 4119]ESK52245.1 hypothetical protein P255_00396 [Acinetobacter brisouii CIP 110357]